MNAASYRTAGGIDAGSNGPATGKYFGAGRCLLSSRHKILHVPREGAWENKVDDLRGRYTR